MRFKSNLVCVVVVDVVVVGATVEAVVEVGMDIVIMYDICKN